MPIFEYKCSACGGDFELLVRSSDTDVACPECGSSRKDKKLIVLASQVDKRAGTAPTSHTGIAGCDLGKCGSGLCGID